jgi:hypothetical protein
LILSFSFDNFRYTLRQQLSKVNPSSSSLVMVQGTMHFSAPAGSPPEPHDQKDEKEDRLLIGQQHDWRNT